MHFNLGLQTLWDQLLHLLVGDVEALYHVFELSAVVAQDQGVFVFDRWNLAQGIYLQKFFVLILPLENVNLFEFKIALCELQHCQNRSCL